MHEISGVAMGWARSRGPRVPVPGTKLQRGGEVRKEWNGKGALGGLSLQFCTGAPEFQVTPLQTVAIHDAGHLSHDLRHCCANMAEWIEVLLGVKTLVDPRNTVSDASPNFPHGFDAAFTKLLWPLVIFIADVVDIHTV